MFPAWPASLLFSSSSCSTSSSSSCFCLSFCFSAGSIEMNRRLSGLNDPVMSTRRLAICWPPTPTCGVLCIQGGGRGGERGNVFPRWKMAAADADAAITFQPSNKYNPLSLSLSLSLCLPLHSSTHRRNPTIFRVTTPIPLSICLSFFLQLSSLSHRTGESHEGSAP